MQRSDLVPFSACAINCLLDRAFRRTPTDQANGSIVITIALRLGQLLRSRIELAEAFLHHRRMVVWLVVWMTMLVMLQASGYIGHAAGSRSRSGRDTTCGISITCVAMNCRTMTIARGSVLAKLDAFLDLHWLEGTAINTLYASTQGLVTQEDYRHLVAFGHIEGHNHQ